MAIVRGDLEAFGHEMEPGVLNRELVTHRIGAEHLTSGVARFAPGAGLPLHTHEVEESVTIIAGEAVCEVAGRFYRLQPYDTSFVPAGVPHRFYNPSTTEPMMMAYAYAGAKVGRKVLRREDVRDPNPRPVVAEVEE